MFTLKSDAFESGGRIPKDYAGDGADVSPPLSWSGVPQGAAELALICDDPDAPREQAWVHWIVYKIPANRTSFSEGSVHGAVEGSNDFGTIGYGGPMPPPGHGIHHYHFRLYALDQPIEITRPGATKAEIVGAMDGHILDEARLVGTYERKR